MRIEISLVLPMLMSLILALTIVHSAQAQQAKPQSDYFTTLSSLCGERFEGTMTFPMDEEHDFANKVLMAKFESCSETTVRVPFTVGEDQSRTWVFRKTSTGIELTHDHRHADGSPDEITNYGGVTLLSGASNAQAFPADELTQKLIPEAATNVWNVSFNSDKSELTYHLERHNKPRFTAVLTRVLSETE